MATFFLHLLNWVKCLKILVTFNPRRRFLLIIRGIFLILLSSRSDKGHERQPNPLITAMCPSLIYQICTVEYHLHMSVSYPPKNISYIPNDFDVVWWCFDKLIGTPFVHHLQRMDPAWEGKKFCVILIRNQPEVPDNFSSEPFQHCDSNQRHSDFFFFFQDWTQKSVAK